MNFVYRLIVAIIAALFISLLIKPLLIGVLPPFGLIVVILLYIADLAYLFGFSPTLFP